MASAVNIGDANLVAYYKLENENDSKGSNHLTNNGSTAFVVAKYVNGASFSSGKSLKVVSNLGLSGNGDGSISFWIKLSQELTSGLWVQVQHGSITGASRYFQCYYDFSGSPRVVADFSGSAVIQAGALGTVNWHHVVITRNVSGNQGYLYIDNTQYGPTALGSATYSDTFSVGGHIDNTLNTNGIIDDVAVYNKVLSSAEVGVLFAGTADSGRVAVTSRTASGAKGSASGRTAVTTRNVV